MQGSIAVVIPLYNKGPHIRRALDSVLAQTAAVDEIIVVDDASTDDGPAQAAGVGDPRIRIVRRDTPGPGGYAARNAGVEAARSEWIAFLDADDSWKPDAMAEVRRLIGLADAGTSSIFTGYARDYGEGVVRSTAFGDLFENGPRAFSFADFLRAWLRIGYSPMWTSAVTARRSALTEAGMFPAGRCNRGGDKDTWLRLLAVGDAIGSGAETAVYHRDSVNMVTKTISVNQRPYLCSTLEGLLPQRTPEEAELIRRLINFEMMFHAREVWRSRDRVRPELFKGFIARQDPLSYLLLLGMAKAPAWALDLSYAAKSFGASLRPRKARSA